MRMLQLVIMSVSILLAQTPAPKGTPKGKGAPVASKPFALKGDVLGETITEFRAKNSRTLSLPPGSDSALHLELDPDLPKTKNLPQCTGDPVSDEEKKRGKDLSVDVIHLTDEQTRAGVVKCVTALSAGDDPDFNDIPTVAEIQAYWMVYYFFRDKLYMIEAVFPVDDYSELKKAFISKYGHPLATNVQYQNSLGAKSAGERLLWTNPLSHIILGQKDMKGIGRGEFEETMQSLRAELAASALGLAVSGKPEYLRLRADALNEAQRIINAMRQHFAPNNVLLVMSHNALLKACEDAGMANRKKDMD